MRRIVVLGVCLLHGCVDRLAVFPCTDAAQCRRDAEQGTCEGTGYCSFTSPDCTTGRRYGEGATSDLKNACVASTSSGRIDVWSPGPALPTGAYAHASASAANHMYLIGGFDNPNAAVLAEVWKASIRDDGSVGPWLEVLRLPNGRRSASAVTANGYLYVLGGRSGAGSLPTAEVSFAPIAPDGTLGGWASTRPLPAAMHGFGAVAIGNRIYVFGGMRRPQSEFVTTDESWVADLDASGQVGPWIATTPLPQPRRALAVVATPGHVYLLGGCVTLKTPCDTGVADAHVAPILSDGRLGAWVTTTALPGPRRDHGAAVFDGFVYVVGGQAGTSSSTRLSNVDAAPIEPDGSLGAWVATTPLPSPHQRPSVVVFAQHIYAFEGRGQETLVAPLIPR